MQNCPNALVVGSADRRVNQRAHALYIEDLQKIRGQVLGAHTHDTEYCKKYLQEVLNEIHFEQNPYKSAINIRMPTRS